LYEVALSPGAGGPRRAYVRELCGRDELDADLKTPTGATRFAANLLVETPGAAVTPADTWVLTLSDRDSILAAVYSSSFGDDVESVVTCQACGKAFEVRFSLEALVTSVRSRTDQEIQGPDADGIYALRDGTRFRLPTADDERAVAGMDPARAVAELLVRCTIDGQASENLEALQAAMEQVGPILTLDVPVPCALCAVEQSVHFDLPSYLDSALRKERPLLAREVHRLASAYHWSLSEILGIPRSQRRMFVGLAEAERPMHSGAGW
jgi:hypothetical protein